MSSKIIKIKNSNRKIFFYVNSFCWCVRIVWNFFFVSKEIQQKIQRKNEPNDNQRRVIKATLNFNFKRSNKSLTI